MSVTGGIMAGVGLAGSIGSAVIGSNAASDAASTQAAAANNAANLQYQASQNALGFQEGQYNNTQSELAPYLQSGASALSNLDYLSGIGQPSSLQGQSANGAASPSGAQNNLQSPTGPVGLGSPGAGAPTSVPTATVPGAVNVSATPNTGLGAAGSLMTPYPGGQFTAPTAAQAEQTPGYQFQMQQGQQALQQSAAARGNLLTGGTAEAVNNYAQGLASTNYQNTYNNAYNTYASNYNQYQNQQANQYNRLASLAGVGQQTAQTLGTLGQNTANSVSNNLMNTASNIGQQGNNAAAANASGIIGSANAYTGAIGSATSNLSNLALLSQLGSNRSGSNPLTSDTNGAAYYG
jgi:hypothetical protein